MPVNLQVADCWEFRVRATADGQAVENVVHIKVRTITQGTPTSQDLVNAYRASWQTLICPLLHESYQAYMYEARRVSNVTGVWPATKVVHDYYAFVIGNEPEDKGTDTNEAAPTFVASSSRKIVAAGTPRVSGGIRLGPIAENKTQVDPNSNLLDTDYRTTVETALNSLNTVNIAEAGPALAECNLAILETQRNRATKPYDAVESVHVIDEFATSPYVSSQVSRKRRNRAL